MRGKAALAIARSHQAGQPTFGQGHQDGPGRMRFVGIDLKHGIVARQRVAVERFTEALVKLLNHVVPVCTGRRRGRRSDSRNQGRSGQHLGQFSHVIPHPLWGGNFASQGGTESDPCCSADLSTVVEVHTNYGPPMVSRRRCSDSTGPIHVLAGELRLLAHLLSAFPQPGRLGHALRILTIPHLAENPIRSDRYLVSNVLSVGAERSEDMRNSEYNSAKDTRKIVGNIKYQAEQLS